MTEVEITKNLLAEAEEALKVEQARLDNVEKTFAENKEKVVKLMREEKFDLAQAQLLEAKVLCVKLGEERAGVENAEARVQSLKESLVRERKREAVAAGGSAKKDKEE